MDPLQSENIQPVRTVWVTRLAEAYPPQYSWACDSQEVETKWATILRTRKLADKREPRRAKTFLVDEEKFLAAGGIVKEDESTVFRDDSTHEVVGVVVRKLIDNPGILEWLDRRVKIACHERRNTRVSSNSRHGSIRDDSADDCSAMTLAMGLPSGTPQGPVRPGH